MRKQAIMYHTSPYKIDANFIHKNGISGDCLFFSDSVYIMSESKTLYVYSADFQCVSACILYDQEIVTEIAEYFDVSNDIAECLLDSSVNEFDYGADSEDSWWLQGKRGQCAVKMGYDGCKDTDEQGAVYIIPMHERESELNLDRVINQQIKEKTK